MAFLTFPTIKPTSCAGTLRIGRTDRGFRQARLSVLMVCLVMLTLSWSQRTNAEQPADNSGKTNIVVMLIDGAQITSDRVERNENADELTAVIERPGVLLTRTLKFSEVRSVRNIHDRQNSREQNNNNDHIVITPSQRDFSTTSVIRAATQVAPSREFLSDDAHRAVQVHRTGDEEKCGLQTYPGRIIGVRDDPLSAYANSVSRAFPNGVPLSEVEFALELMRAERTRDVLTPELQQVPESLQNNPPKPAGDDAASPQRGKMSPAPPPQPQARRGRVDGVLVDVRPISSQGRSDWDSLLLEVHAVDPLGRDVPVSGTIQATLWGRRQQLVRSTGDIVTEELGDITKLAEWTRNLQSTTDTVRAANGAATSAAQFVVPLSRPLPEHDLKLAAFGDLHVRLSVPGDGVFEATQSGVPLRKLSLVRARNVVERGSVILPGEFTTDSPTSRGSLQFARPTSGPDRRVLTVEP